VTGNTVDNWCGTCVEMLDPDADGVYEVTMQFGLGDHEYKFNNGGWGFTEVMDSVADASCTLTTDEFTNRLLTVITPTAVVLPAVCFEACDACLVDGTAELSAARFSMYPTIASDMVKFNFPSGNDYNRVISIYNTSSQMVENTTLGNGVSSFDLDVTSFAAGLYIVNVQVAGAVEVKKLVITK
jgi:hypothetical protein